MSIRPWYGDIKRNVAAKAGLALVGIGALISQASASTVNLTSVWDFITELTSHQDSIISIIILGAIVFVVRKFGSGLGTMLNLGGGGHK